MHARVKHIIAAWLVAAAAAAQPPLPRIGSGLIVDGKPYLILGGELANSSASDRAYMAPRWAKLRAMNLNTVLMPVSWELIEPQQGRFDFALVDGLIEDAHAHGLRLVLLWFGSWKNSMSSYAPAWVKRDSARFPRARTADGKPIEMLSAFAPANAAADARAFAALMQHLAVTDRTRTVIMVQVENEVGMIPEARDRSPLALAAWARPVPAALPGAGKSWTAAYGKGADEAFMAWGFGQYVEQVASAGKRAYPLPMYVNAALPRPTALPGTGYPAAGPLPKLATIWRAATPSVDLLAPDIYFPNFVEWTRAFAALGPPLFLPEAGQGGDAATPANALFAIGQLGAIGFSPFAIDAINPAAAKDLTDLYSVISSLTPLILERRGTGRIAGARPPIDFAGSADLADQVLIVDDTRLTVRFIDPWTPRGAQSPERHGALILTLGKNEFLVAGRGVTITFAPQDGKGSVGIESIDEGRYVDGDWIAGRRLNGDESHQGRHLRLSPDTYATQRIRLYRYR